VDKLLIQGGTPLAGEIAISGAKNAALPILCAGLLFVRAAASEQRAAAQGHLDDAAPDRADGRRVTDEGADGVSLDSRGLDNPLAPYDMVKTMRASILVLGSPAGASW
jgi:UDP-N-acetylglucosamine 1-carboxyvinyltransferase